MSYSEILPSNIAIVPMENYHVSQLEVLQHRVFPHLAEDEILHANQYLRHLEIFPEGQFTAMVGETVAGATTTMRYHYNIHQQHYHTFKEATGDGWLTIHDPNGEWLYGVDICVSPAYRKMGIAKALYRARQHTCRMLNLKGQFTVGMLNGYKKLRNDLTIEEYFMKVKHGEIFDPTVSVQQRIGFEIIGLMKNYLHDPTCGNAGAILVLDAAKEV
jgi:GNAT superfamily N-acetyltransferase